MSVWMYKLYKLQVIYKLFMIYHRYIKVAGLVCTACSEVEFLDVEWER